MSSRSSPGPRDPNETPVTVLAAACSSLGKRVRFLADRGDGAGAGARFVKCLHDAVELIHAAAEVLSDPAAHVPELKERPSGSAVAPRMIAAKMSCAIQNGAPAPPTTPPGDGNEDPAFENLLHGAATSVSISELLDFLGSLRKTGILWVMSRDETFTIQLHDGFVVNAFSNNAPPGERLGDILVQEGGIDPEEFDRFLTSHEHDDGRIGAAMMRKKLISEEKLTAALELQVQQLFLRMFATPNTTFSFSERPNRTDDPQVRLSLTRLLLESARVHDEDRASSPGTAPQD